MWLFGGASATQAEEEEARRYYAADEAEALDEEVEELELKREALLMAEYRQAQRIACGLEAPSPTSDRGDSALAERRLGAYLAASTACGSTAVPQDTSPKMSTNDERSQAMGNDLEDMYDFSSFLVPSSEATKSTASTASPQGDASRAQVSDSGAAESACDTEEDEDSSSEGHTHRLVAFKVRQREDAAEAQQRRLAAASRAIEKTKAQIQQLTELLEGRLEDDAQCNPEFDALRRLVAEKKQPLQVALDEAASALNHEADSEARDISRTQHREPLRKMTAAMAKEKEEHDEQMAQLVAMTEELADALDRAQSGEDAARKELSAAVVYVQQERAHRLAVERELAIARQTQDKEVAALRERLQVQEKSLATERARVKELEARPSPVDIDVIKKGSVAYPHMEV